MFFLNKSYCYNLIELKYELLNIWLNALKTLLHFNYLISAEYIISLKIEIKVINPTLLTELHLKAKSYQMIIKLILFNK